jgi:hypothetical protein
MIGKPVLTSMGPPDLKKLSPALKWFIALFQKERHRVSSMYSHCESRKAAKLFRIEGIASTREITRQVIWAEGVSECPSLPEPVRHHEHICR